METALDLPADAFEEDEAAFLDGIRGHGWTGTMVSADTDVPGFAYTTGFYLSLGHPEIVWFPLMPPDSVNRFHWTLARRIEEGGSLPVGRSVAGILAGSYRVVFVPVSEPMRQEYLRFAHWFYRGHPFGALQMVLPDAAGRFPWQAAGRFPWQKGYAVGTGGRQPDLTDGDWAGLAER